MSNDVPKWFIAELRASYERLVRAGVLASYTMDEVGSTGHVSYSPHALRLLTSGRRLASEPEFLRLLNAGAPDAVRAWLAAEVAKLDE